MTLAKSLSSRARAICSLSVLALAAACGSEPSTSVTLGRATRWEQEAQSYGPNPALTPGHLCTKDNPDFDGQRYHERIAHCRRSVSREEKVQIGLTYGIPGGDLHAYEIDHFIPLSVGGSNEPANLWPLYSPIARQKSQREGEIHAAVSAGTMTQAEAIAAIRAWRPTALAPH